MLTRSISSYHWLMLLAMLASVLALQACDGRGEAPDTIGWRHDFDAALQEAQATGRPVLLDFTADWCPPCQSMAHDVFPRDDVSRLVRGGFVPTKIDLTDNRGPGGPIAQRYNVGAIPTLIVTDAQGQELARAVGGKSAQGLIDWLTPHAASVQ